MRRRVTKSWVLTQLEWEAVQTNRLVGGLESTWHEALDNLHDEMVRAYAGLQSRLEGLIQGQDRRISDIEHKITYLMGAVGAPLPNQPGESHDQ